MNKDLFDFDEKISKLIDTLESDGKIPHAVIIECDDKGKSLEIAKYLSMYAVCSSDNKPCGICKQCHNAFNQAHADIKYAYPEGKSGRYSIVQLRDIIEDSAIRPNDADTKVYIFESADERLDTVQQNSILKLIEEPPQNVLFIFTCENSRRLLITIRSRCTLLKISSEKSFDETSRQYAFDIVKGMVSTKEYDLLKALNVLTDKEKSGEVLQIVKLVLRDGLVLLSGGNAVTNEELARQLSTRFTMAKLILMIELTDDAERKIAQNININLLTTWLCGEYRRISWQR